MKPLSWIWRWTITGVMTTIATTLLTLPAAVPAWLVYSWAAPHVGLPPVGFLECWALIYVARLCQAAAVIRVPEDMGDVHQ